MKTMDPTVLAVLACQVSALLFSLQWPLSSAQSLSLPGFVLRIDCGGFSNFTSQYNESWTEDMFFTGGSASFVSQPDIIPDIEERTIRYFPTTGGKKHCYIVPVPNGRYFIRMFFVYGNYDNKTQTPSFDVSIAGTVVFSWRNPWSPNAANLGAFADLEAFVTDGQVSTCFYSIATDSPVVGTLEIVQVDPLSYDSTSTGQNVILVNYGRATAGNISFGAGLTNNSDVGGRAWQVDTFYSSTPKQIIQTTEPIKGADVAPNYFPTMLYQSSRTLQEQPGTPTIDYTFPVDSSADYMIWLHFAEIEQGVSAPGQRVFDIAIDGLLVFPMVDVFKEVGNYAAYDLNYTVKNLTDTSLTIKFTPHVGMPIVSGVEVLAILPAELTTQPTECRCSFCIL